LFAGCEIIAGGGMSMGAYKKTDFYYGAFISALLNKVVKVALIDRGENEFSRRRLQITTDKSEYEFYCKHANTKSNKHPYLWNFHFTPNEIDELKDMFASGLVGMVALICLQGDIASQYQELAIISESEFKKCAGDNKPYKNSNLKISVKSAKGSPYLAVYGTMLDSTKAIKIKRNLISDL
jgi:hypothetical protein